MTRESRFCGGTVQSNKYVDNILAEYVHCEVPYVASAACSLRGLEDSLGWILLQEFNILSSVLLA